MADHSDGAYVPEVADLSKFGEIVERTRGIFIKDVPANTILRIDAEDAVFTVVIIDPAERKIKIQGSQYLPELVDAIVSGSTFGGCMLKQGWIGVGMCLEIFIHGRELPRITTSTIQGIGVVVSGSSSIQ